MPVTTRAPGIFVFTHFIPNLSNAQLDRWFGRNGNGHVLPVAGALTSLHGQLSCSVSGGADSCTVTLWKNGATNPDRIFQMSFNLSSTGGKVASTFTVINSGQNVFNGTTDMLHGEVSMAGTSTIADLSLQLYASVGE